MSRSLQTYLIAAAAALVMTGCTTTESTDADTTTSALHTTTSTTPAESLDGAAIAKEAEQVVRESFFLEPDEPFAMYECQSSGALCWAQYITGFEYEPGVLRIRVQVDRQTDLGQEIGANTAKGVRNFLVTEGGVLRPGDWVEAVDGTGVSIAQQPT